MCGLIFVHRIDKANANKATLKRYNKQKSRGSSGFGYVAINGNKLKSYKRAKLESQIKTFIEKENVDTILFHHRFPTSTPNLKESAHPIKVSHIDLKYDYYLIHNGIIENADDLKEKHEKLGFVYNTEITKKWLTSGSTYKEVCFNDSEALAVDVALAIDKGTMKIEAEGSIAFIVAQVHKSSNTVKAVYYARNNGNPLQFDRSKELISISSECGGEMVLPYKLYKLDLKTNKIADVAFDIPIYHAYTGYNTGYSGYSGYGGYNGYGYKKDTDKTDGYGTTFGSDDDDNDVWGYKEHYLQQKELFTDKDGNLTPTLVTLQDKYQEVEFEIMETEETLQKLNDNNDGSPESENQIVEGEAILDSLYSQLDKLDAEILDETLK